MSVEQELQDLKAFLDACNVPPAATLLDRVRDFYHGCTDTVNKYRDRLGELPYINDPREQPFIEGWKRCLVHVVEGAAGVAENRGLTAAHVAFRHWTAEVKEKHGV